MWLSWRAHCGITDASNVLRRTNNVLRMAFFVSFSLVTYGNTIKPMQKMVNSGWNSNDGDNGTAKQMAAPNDKDRVLEADEDAKQPDVSNY